MKIYSNIVPETVVRNKQLKTLEIISNSIENSFGPMGSHTAIVGQVGNTGQVDIKYSKDGHTIIDNMFFRDTIEQSVKTLISSLTHHIVKEVGDGTTSAVMLSKNIFSELCNNDSINLNTTSPAAILKIFNDVVEKVKEVIESESRECTLDDIYNIALISTNNNEEMASIIKNIYEKFGMEVFIDVGSSISSEHIVKEYDGMTLDTGIAQECFVNDHKKNVCTIRNPRIYAFNDPIDTPEMLGLLDAILVNNILRCYQEGSVYMPEPTVIFCKALSPDTSSYFETICRLLESPIGDQVPLLIVSDIHQEYLFEDIMDMCGAKPIKKYLNPDIQKEDIEKGLAPTNETIIDFCGYADLVVADQNKTKIINPKEMLNEDGSYSDRYKARLSFLENELSRAQREGEGINVTGKLKRRINSFKGNMVDFLIGGISESDKNNTRAAVEDAVLNCRSAAKYGVGYGANFMGYRAIHSLIEDETFNGNAIANIIDNAYRELCVTLYGSIAHDRQEGENIVKSTLENGCPLNIRTNEYDHKVLSSIRSDIIILETVSKILSLMFTCNQYLVPSPAHNIYISEVEE